jgi:energy coupling factor transporter S component ThiW
MLAACCIRDPVSATSRHRIFAFLIFKIERGGSFMTKTKKLALSGVLVAIGVAGSVFHIPVGVIKLSPVQHMVNVLAVVLLGPGYAVGAAFATSLLRVTLGLGSLLAFPGSLCGALLCGWLFGKTKQVRAAFIGEVLGTGIFGALLAYPAARILLGKEIALTVLIPSFGLSTLAGAALSVLFLKIMEKPLQMLQTQPFHTSDHSNSIQQEAHQE